MSGIKTFSNETSERYALALFELANEKSELEDIEKNISLILEICESNSDFNSFLKNPTNQLEFQSKVFTEISKIMKLNKNFSNFLSFFSRINGFKAKMSSFVFHKDLLFKSAL